MTKEELIDAIAGMIEGLAVPYSLDRRMLGTAGPEWLKIHTGLDMFGYPNRKEIKKELLKVLNSE